MSDTVL